MVAPETAPMNMDSLFQRIAEYRREHRVAKRVHLTLANEMDLYRELLEQSHRLGEEAADRFHKDRRYIRTYLATIEGILVVWNAPEFKLE